MFQKILTIIFNIIKQVLIKPTFFLVNNKLFALICTTFIISIFMLKSFTNKQIFRGYDITYTTFILTSLILVQGVFLCIYLGTSSDLDKTNNITNIFTYSLGVILLLCFGLINIIQYTTNLDEIDSAQSRIFSYVKLGFKWSLLLYVLYVVLVKSEIGSTIYTILYNKIIFPVVLYIIDEIYDVKNIPISIWITIGSIITIILGILFNAELKNGLVYIFNPSTKKILHSGVQLREKTIVATFEQLNPNFLTQYEMTQEYIKKQANYIKKYHSNGTKGTNFKIIKNKDGMDYSYGIRFKYYLHQPGSYTLEDVDKNIFTFGQRPRITFNPNTQTMKIFVRDTLNNDVQVYSNSELTYQKWEEITINVIDGKVDVFLNRELLSTTNVLPFSTKDSIILGEKNGINGAIKNIEYNKHPYMF